MIWHPAGNKPLSEPMMAQFTVAYRSLGLDGLKKNPTIPWFDDNLTNKELMSIHVYVKDISLLE